MVSNVAKLAKKWKSFFLEFHDFFIYNLSAMKALKYGILHFVKN